ncbi:MAG: outer membrane beta-barrel family protein [Muribaculaceae bacterium]|nr:outer membrane beta-barrel family protein [Muribaculaceae bacterium]
MRFLLTSFAIVSALASWAQSETTDSTKTTDLKEVVVEGELQETSARKTTFYPTTRQKRASQTGTDLLDHIGIPQLNITPTGSVETNSGKPVAIFIDYLPASQDDLKAMRMADVRSVDYYEFPSDPRFQGNMYVVNYTMVKYEYGGYVKGFGYTNFLTGPIGQLLANARLQYKKMTYDIMGSGFARNSSHEGSELLEKYRFPDKDGNMLAFDRLSNTLSSDQKNRRYFAAFKANYNSEKIQASSQINASLNNMPVSDKSGSVTYFPADFPSSSYSSTLNETSKFISFYGYYFFSLPKKNSLTFTPAYTFSHTDRNTSYLENGFSPIFNNASDNTNQLSGSLRFNHDFGKGGELLASLKSYYDYNRTLYTGSSNSLDRSKSFEHSAGVTYSVPFGNFYGTAGFGWIWRRSIFNDSKEISSNPWMNFSLQYGFRKKHSIAAEFHYSTWAPSSNFKSDDVIKSTPLLSYVGNPNLIPFKSYDINLRYTWLPNKNYSFSAFAYAWIVGDRYVYDYEPTPDGILRTIKQPMGGYVQSQYGINGTMRFLNRSLVVYARIAHLLNHNGRPYNVNHSYVNWNVRVRYYLKDWNFAVSYVAPSGSPDGCMVGIWDESKSYWYISAGWANDHWNLKMTCFNLHRWNWRSNLHVMNSPYYSTRQQYYGTSDHALIKLTATYTFGFGKKVKHNGELSVSGEAASGILNK